MKIYENIVQLYKCSTYNYLFADVQSHFEVHWFAYKLHRHCLIQSADMHNITSFIHLQISASRRSSKNKARHTKLGEPQK